jgi:dCTP deaminase
MAFWSSQRVKAEQRKLRNLVEPFKSERVRQGAYELALSRQVLTGPPQKGERRDGIGDSLEISPGEFALLYTEETVTIPASVIAFISIKASLKLDGLVNISGFHVDPGFSSRLKFSVYNAGNLPIYLPYEREAFLIWFSDLDEATDDPYDASHQHFKQSGITPIDRQRMSRRSYSPAALNRRLEEAERKIRLLFAVGAVIATGILVPLLKGWLERQLATRAATPSPTPAAVTAVTATPNP